MGDSILEIRHLSKAFGKHVVLRDIDFSVSKGDVTCIIGASGSGKSTLLRCINFLEEPTSGEIIYHGLNMMESRMNEAIAGLEEKDSVDATGEIYKDSNYFNILLIGTDENTKISATMPAETAV